MNPRLKGVWSNSAFDRTAGSHSLAGETIGQVPLIEPTGGEIEHDTLLLVRGGVDFGAVENEERLRLLRWDAEPFGILPEPLGLGG